MQLFKRRERKESVQTEASARLRGWLFEIAQRINGWLQSYTRRFSTGKLKIICLLFVLLAGGGSGWVLVRSLTRPTTILHIQPISRPAEIPLGGAGYGPDDSVVFAAMSRVRAFIQKMDSLRNDPVGRRWRDSIQMARPGLFDSIEVLEKWYARPLRRGR